MNANFFILLGVFVSTLLLFQGGYYYYLSVRGLPAEKVNRRLKMHAANKSNQQVMSILRREQDQGLVAFVKSLFPRLDALITQTGMTVSTLQITMTMIFTCLMIFIILFFIVGVPFAISLILGSIIGVTLLIFYLKIKAKNRLKLFSAQLPDALDLIVRCLKAGHPINAAMGLVAEEMSDPIGSEFGLTVDEMTYGHDLREALSNMAVRLPHPDLKYMVVTIEIQHATGGNLAEVLTSLSKIMRGRVHMFGRIRSLSAEGRFSAYIVSALPIIVFFGLSIMSPTYFLDVSDDELYWPLLGGALSQLMIGNYMMFKMVNFKV